MAREAALWQRCLTGAKALRFAGHKLDLQRLENLVGVGHPDVEGCLDGAQLWIELKSCTRPARPDTPIRPKKRISQEIWHETRAKAGCRCHWILLQVGEDREAVLYLIPGRRYSEITVPEEQLAALSVLPASATASQAIVRAAQGW